MTTPVQPPYSAPKASGGLYIRLADLLVAAGGILILLFSWAPIVSFGSELEDNGIGRSLWSWLSPIGLFVVLAVLLLIGTAVADIWWKKDAPLVGLHRHHVQVGLALFVLVDIIGLTFASIGGVSPSVGFGGVVDILFALVATAGAVLNFFNQLQNPIGMPNVSVSAPHAHPVVPTQQTDPSVPSPSDPTV